MEDFEVFNSTPQSRKAEREQLAEQIAKWLATGHHIKEIPAGISKYSPKPRLNRAAKARRQKEEHVWREMGSLRLQQKQEKKKRERVTRKKPSPKTETARAATLADIPTFVTLYPRKHKQGVNP